MDLLTHFSQEEPFDLSQKAPSLRLSQSDGESVPGSSCQEEDDESLYRRSQYSPEVDQHEPAGEDQYANDVKGSPDEARPGETQQTLDGETLESQSDPRPLQSKTSYESDLDVDEPAYVHDTRCRQTYDSEPDEQSREALDGFHEADADISEGSHSTETAEDDSHGSECTGPEDEDEED